MKVFRYNEIDVNNIDIFDGCFLSYHSGGINGTLIVQTDWIELVYNRNTWDENQMVENVKFPINPDSRTLKITLDKQQIACVRLKEHLKKMNEYYSSKKFQKQFFGDKIDRCIYQSLIKDIDLDKIPCCVMQFRKNSARDNTTDIIKIMNEKEISENIKWFPTIAQKINMLSKVKLIFEHDNIWTIKCVIEGKKKILYGVSLRILLIKYIPFVNERCTLHVISGCDND